MTPALCFIAFAVLALALVVWLKPVAVTVNVEPAKLEPTIHVAPATVAAPHVVVHTPEPPAHPHWPAAPAAPNPEGPKLTYVTGHSFLVELLKDGKHLGWRHPDHPDVHEAIKTPRLSVRFPDGTIEGE